MSKILNWFRNVDPVAWVLITVLALLAILVFGVIPASIVQGKTFNRACTSSGGVVLNTRNRDYCLKKEAVIVIPDSIQKNQALEAACRLKGGQVYLPILSPAYCAKEGELIVITR